MEGSKESGSDPRTNFRSNVFLVAALKTLEGTVPVRVRNLSATGALLEGDGLPGDAVGVLLERGQLTSTARSLGAAACNAACALMPKFRLTTG